MGDACPSQARRNSAPPRLSRPGIDLMTPAKVLWISCVGEKGGAEVYLINFVRNLDPDRFRPSVVLLRPGPFEADLKTDSIQTFVLKRHRMRNALSVSRAILQIHGLVVRHG